MGLGDLTGIPELYWAIAFGFLAVFVLGFRERIRAWFDRVEARVQARHRANAREREDPLAHFHATIAEIEARTPPPERTAFGDRWRFGRETFARFEDADDARRQAILAEARAFYQDLDRTRLGRR